VKRSRIPFLLLLAGCAGAPPQSPESSSSETPRPGGYYKDDGPGDQVPPDLASIPDAQAKVEPLSRFANRPYDALGNHYVPLVAVQPFHERGLASWYGRRYHGRKTTSGEVYDMYAMTAAHPTLPIPSYARVTGVATGRSVVVRINDRGPFLRGRVIDLSYAAAHRLGIIANGSGEVDVDAIVPGQAEQSQSAALDTIAPSAPISPSAAAVAPGIFLQLGAFASRDNAESLRARLAPFAEPTEVLLLGNLWRLQLGPYRSQDEARSAGERLERTYDLKPLVVVR
jgi:rare lipoprotein A